MANSLKELANQLLTTGKNRAEQAILGKLGDVVNRIPYGDQLSQWLGVDRGAHTSRGNEHDPTNLQAFLSLLKTEGLVTADRFKVTFTAPTNINPQGAQNVGVGVPARTLSLLCEEASLPQHSLRTRTVRINGLDSHRAAGLDYHSETITFGFYLQQSLRAKKFFDNWMDGIVSPISREMTYYKDYTAPVEICILAKDNAPLYTVQLMDCFPRNVHAIPLSFGNTQMLKVMVDMTFNRWTVLGSTGEHDVEQQGSAVVDNADNSFLTQIERQAIGSIRDIGVRVATQKIGGPIVRAVNEILGRTR